MDDCRIKRALISVYYKDGIEELAKYLASEKVEILSTSKTAKMISDLGIPVTKIEDVTKFPEILGGRVKTLHPNIFAGILSRRGLSDDAKSLESHGIREIDLVVVNLYPFVETISRKGVTLEEAIENIDVGGPSMIRAAAKNHRDVAVLTDTGDYGRVISELKTSGCRLSVETRQKLAYKAFKLTCEYDTHISNYLGGVFMKDEDQDSEMPEKIPMNLSKIGSLRYGENPHQKAALYSIDGISLNGTLAGARPTQGKEISYNNLMDAEGAINVARDIEGKFVSSIIKHTNPCGVGRSGEDLIDAYRLALACDPISAFGGIVCLTGEVDGELAEEINKLFTEVIIAPKFSKDSLKIFSKKKNLRLIELDFKKCNRRRYDFKMIDGGALVQELDLVSNDLKDARVVTKREPAKSEMEALRFAMNICKNVKSNAIVITNAKQSVGIGAGQTSRVDSCRIAMTKARLPLKGCVLASDAFFPFRDSIDLVAGEGITAVIQPGGSLKDEEVVNACNEHNIAMIFTGIRHFRH